MVMTQAGAHQVQVAAWARDEGGCSFEVRILAPLLYHRRVDFGWALPRENLADVATAPARVSLGQHGARIANSTSPRPRLRAHAATWTWSHPPEISPFGGHRCVKPRRYHLTKKFPTHVGVSAAGGLDLTGNQASATASDTTESGTPSCGQALQARFVGLAGPCTHRLRVASSVRRAGRSRPE